MPKLMSIDDFKKLREESRRDIAVRLKTGTKIIVGLGTCGIAAGARDTMQAILSELKGPEADYRKVLVFVARGDLDDAMAELRLLRGFVTVERLRNDPRLDQLRARADFRALLEED